MSNRLDSLNTKKPSGSKAPLKFKPKVVLRKTKQELENSAPVEVKQEEGTKKQDFSPKVNKRINRDQFQNTSVISAGPLSSGSVSINDEKVNLARGPSSEGTTRSVSVATGSNTKTSSSFGNIESHDLDEEGVTVNIAKIRDSNPDSRFLPVRPRREETPEADNNQREELTPPPERSVSPMKVDIYDEDDLLESKLERIKETKANLESKITEPINLLNDEEYKRAAEDQKYIMELLTEGFDNLNTDQGDDRGYILFQLPPLLPKYEVELDNTSPPIKVEDDKAFSLPEEQLMVGEIGHLNLHKSGKVTLNLGNDNDFNLSAGAGSNTLNELVLVDFDEEQEFEMHDETGAKIWGKLHELGTVRDKIICTPVL